MLVVVEYTKLYLLAYFKTNYMYYSISKCHDTWAIKYVRK